MPGKRDQQGELFGCFNLAMLETSGEVRALLQLHSSATEQALHASTGTARSYLTAACWEREHLTTKLTAGADHGEPGRSC